MRGDPVTYEFKTSDHPEANGRKAQHGETEYPMTFTSDKDELIIIRMGRFGFETVTNLLTDMLANMPSHDDGSLPLPCAIGDRVCVSIKEPIAIGIVTAIDRANTSFPYEVEWTRADGSKYRTDCGHQLRRAK